MRMRGDCVNMKIQIDEDIYSGSAVEIMEQLRQRISLKSFFHR